MVPTELLAVQHYEHLNKLLENMEDVERKPSIALLTGSTPSKQSRIILEAWINVQFFCFVKYNVSRILVIGSDTNIDIVCIRVSGLEKYQWSLEPPV